MKQIHECEYCKGVMSDVTYRNNRFYCRKCGDKLQDNQVQDKMFKQIR